MKKMTTKIKESLTNNFSLKLIAIIIAAIVWLVVVNVNDPEKTIMIYSIPVTVVDEEAVTDMDMVYNVTSGSYVNITVSGKRSVLNGLGAGDFVATASLKELSKVNAVPIEVTTKEAHLSNKVSIEKQSEHSMIVELENMEIDTFDITVEYKGNAATGFVPGTYTLSQTTVDVQAPVSILDKIDKVVAVCKLEGNDEDFTKSCRIQLYDRKGERIKSGNIKLSTKNVNVDVDLLFSKEVPLVVETVGNPDAGYQVSGVTLSMETVNLLADKDILDNMNQLVVDPNISLVDETEDVVRTIDLVHYLPEGVSIQGETTVEIVVNITKLTQKTFKLKKSDVNIENVPEGLEADLTKNIEVILQGDKDVIDGIAAEELNATIDLKGEKEGKVKVPVVITIPDGTELVKEVVATVELK